MVKAALQTMVDAENQRYARDHERDPVSSPYYEGGPHSWFQDRVLVREAEERADAAAMDPGLRGIELGAARLPQPGEPTVEQARQRLDDLRSAQKLNIGYEQRDLSTSDAPGGGAFVPAGAPIFVAEAFGDAARLEASLAREMVQRPLPPYGKTVESARIESGAAVAIQASENSSVQETDLDVAVVSAPIGLIAGQNDVSRQLFERSVLGIDDVLARDLGRALAIEMDRQLVSGSGLSGQLKGLASVSGIVSVSYTDASPTPAELVSKIWSAFEQLSGASGFGVSDPSRYLLVMHPRRFAWLANGFSTPIRELLPFRIVISAAVRSTLGAGTNEDEIFLLVKDQAIAYLGEPSISVYPEIGSAAMTIRVQARQYGSLLVRVPNAIARVSGSGLTAPVL
jgi:HK97 family phage major capsid protein